MVFIYLGGLHGSGYGLVFDVSKLNQGAVFADLDLEDFFCQRVSLHSGELAHQPYAIGHVLKQEAAVLTGFSGQQSVGFRKFCAVCAEQPNHRAG